MKARALGWILVVAGSALGSVATRAAYSPIPEPEKTGQELARRVRSMAPAEDLQYSATLKILTRGAPARALPVTFAIHLDAAASDGPKWQAVYQVQPTSGGPAERLVVQFQVGHSNVYTHVRGADSATDPRKGAQLETPLAGSDFWLCDLGLEFLHWPQQKALKTEMRRGRVCRVLESENPHPTPDGYARVRSWIDLETGGLLQAEAYNARHRLLKEFSVGSFKKVDGRWQMKDMKIVNVPKRSRTWLEFDLPE